MAVYIERILVGRYVTRSLRGKVEEKDIRDYQAEVLSCGIEGVRILRGIVSHGVASPAEGEADAKERD